jgi:cytochrome c oxidase subunit 3
MDVGTVEISEKEDEPGMRKAGRSGTSGSKGGGGGGDNGKDPGGGGDRPRDDDELRDPAFVPGKSRILTGFLLVVVMMTFGGLIAAYVVIATNGAAEWQPFALPIQVWVSTAIIIASSITYYLGQRGILANDQPRAKRWMVVTTIFGASFISSQLLVWLALVNRGLYMSTNPYAGFFYIMTAVHAVHVLGGIIALGSILLRVWHPVSSEESKARRSTMSQVVGWYWHFMGALWFVLLGLLGFWR